MATKTKTATKKKPAAAKTKTAAAKTKTAAKTGAMSLKQLAAGLADKFELGKAVSVEIATHVFDTIAIELKRGTKIRVPGFGIFAVANRAARMGRNPATGEAIKIKASKKVRFRPAKELKESI